MTELHAMHAQVWAARHEQGDKWPASTPQDALRWATWHAANALKWSMQKRTEETLQAFLHVDELVASELADCAIMLLTAVGPECPRVSSYGRTTLDYLCRMVAESMEGGLSGSRSPARLARIVTAIACYPGLDLAAELAARLAHIRRNDA